MSENIYGYIRVSTREQNEARQLVAMREFGVPEGNIFMDKQSGKDFERPAYQRMMDVLSEGSVLVIKSIDRLGRNYDETIDEWRRITREKRAKVILLDMPLLNSLQAYTLKGAGDLLARLIADLVLYLLSYFAQTEREMIHQRQAEGIAAAKQRGVRLGAVPKERTAEFYELKETWARGEISARRAAEILSIDHHTFLRWVREES